MLIGGSEYTTFFKCPHKKKSSVRSGDLGGHSTGPYVAINLSPNSIANYKLLKKII